ncbi:MAG: hypothetical protein J0H82_22275 [Alphaproteobacteria bacterium]|nr:hypothetical protein [Alphaproteobacteria bacterium]
MKLMRVVCGAMVLPLVIACASVAINPADEAKPKIGMEPAIGTETTANVGGLMFSQYDYLVGRGATTRLAFHDTIGPGAMVDVPAGASLVSAMVNGRQAYCTTWNAYVTWNVRSPVCMFDTNNDGVLDKYYVTGTFSGIEFNAHVPYVVGEVPVDAAGYKYELYYQGADRDVVRLTFREFKDKFSQAAMQQDITYTLQSPGPTQVSFRNVRLTIISADNHAIRYSVQSPFVSK